MCHGGGLEKPMVARPELENWGLKIVHLSQPGEKPPQHQGLSC